MLQLRRSTGLLVVLGVVGLVSAGCSGGDSASSSNDVDGSASGSDGGGGTNDGSTGGDGGAGGNDAGRTDAGGGGGNDAGGGGNDGGGGGNDGGGGGNDSGGGGGAIKTVFLIVMENHNWSSIKGNASAPYINGLLATGAHAESYYDNPAAAHPSEPNYLWLEGGDNFGILNDGTVAANHKATTNHLVTLLAAANVTWRTYVEGISGNNCPITSSGLYATKHTPMIFFDDVVGNPPSAANANCKAHVRPYTELAGDLTNNAVARYNFITPDLCNDMHNSSGCATNDPVKNGDTWLAAEVPKILASQAYANNGAIFITWDESEGGENPIGMIVLSPKAKVGYANTATKYYHSSMLRTVQEIFGVTPLIADAANQPSLSDLFTSYP